MTVVCICVCGGRMDSLVGMQDIGTIDSKWGCYIIVLEFIKTKVE